MQKLKITSKWTELEKIIEWNNRYTDKQTQHVPFHIVFLVLKMCFIYLI